MDYYVYELVYSESLEELCARLDVNIFLGSLEYNIKVLNDVVLVHMIYKVIKKNKYYTKEEIRGFLRKKISIKIPKGIRKMCGDINYMDYERGYDELFDYCWEQKMRIDGMAKELKFYAYDNMPKLKKLYNSNWFLLFFAIGLMVIQTHIIGSLRDIVSVFAISILMISLFLPLWENVFMRRSKLDFSRWIYRIPKAQIISWCVVIFMEILDPECENFVHTEDYANMVWVALTHLSIYPVLWLNEERMIDLYQHQMYGSEYVNAIHREKYGEDCERRKYLGLVLYDYKHEETNND